MQQLPAARHAQLRAGARDHVLWLRLLEIPARTVFLFVRHIAHLREQIVRQRQIVDLVVQVLTVRPARRPLFSRDLRRFRVHHDMMMHAHVFACLAVQICRHWHIAERHPCRFAGVPRSSQPELELPVRILPQRFRFFFLSAQGDKGFLGIAQAQQVVCAAEIFIQRARQLLLRVRLVPLLLLDVAFNLSLRACRSLPRHPVFYFFAHGARRVRSDHPVALRHVVALPSLFSQS